LNKLPNCLKDLKSVLNADSRQILDTPENFRRAAVLIPIIERENEWTLIFTRRTSNVSKHRGEISFPGGRFNKDLDKNLVDTALRETEEEIGIKHISVIGQIDDISTISKYIVTPVIGYIVDNSEINHQTINAFEIDYMLEVPLSRLTDSEIYSQKHVSHKSGSVLDVPFFDYDGEVIWGATGRILVNFLKKLNKLSSECRLNLMKRELWFETES